MAIYLGTVLTRLDSSYGDLQVHYFTLHIKHTAGSNLTDVDYHRSVLYLLVSSFQRLDGDDY